MTLLGDSCNVSVLLVEHQDNFDTTEFFVRSVFRAIGYGIAVRRVDATTLIIDNKKSNPLFSEPFDVVVSDISWGADIEAAQGLSAIRYFRRNWPDLLIIGCSRSQLTYPQVAIKQPSFHLFAYKPEFTNKKYLTEVAVQVRHLFRRNVNVSCAFDQCQLNNGWQKPADRLELIGILRQLTFSGHKADDSIGCVRLFSISGGFSKAKVYRMEAETKSGAGCVSTVVKVSDCDGAARELTNYESYVKWGLPFRWRPELLSSAFTASFGAVCYSFVEMSPTAFCSLNELIAVNDISGVYHVIASIFDPEQQQWYHERNVKLHRVEGDDSGLTTYYRERWFPDPPMVPRSNASLKAFGREHGWDLSRADTVSFNHNTIRMPESVLMGQIRFAYHTCVRHGDLHGGNIMVSPSGQCCFIDFQETGRGHVFEDFVVLEGSLRLHYRSNKAFEECYSRERELLSFEFGDSTKESCVDVIEICREIRARARANFPSEGWGNYVYALGLFCFRLLRIDDFEDWQRVQIIACLMACVNELEKC